MKPYGAKHYGSIRNKHFPHGDSCGICYDMGHWQLRKGRSLKKGARRRAKEMVRRFLYR